MLLDTLLCCVLNVSFSFFPALDANVEEEEEGATEVFEEED